MGDELSGGAKCVKYIMFFFNLLFLLGGLALIIVGALVQVNTRDNTFSSWASGSGIFIIVVGSIVFLVSFFGCAGAMNNNYCMVMTYAVLLILLLLAEVAGVIAAFILKDKLKDQIRTDMQTSQIKYDPNDNKTETIAMDETQRTMKCCGVNGSDSWDTNPHYTSRIDLPDSCCSEDKPLAGCGKGRFITKEHIYTEGCYDALFEHLKHYLVAVGAVAAGVAFVELIGIVFACCLASQLRKDYRVV